MAWWLFLIRARFDALCGLWPPSIYAKSSQPLAFLRQKNTTITPEEKEEEEEGEEEEEEAATARKKRSIYWPGSSSRGYVDSLQAFKVR